MGAHLRRSNVVLFLIVSLVATLVTSSLSQVGEDKVKLNLYYESLCPNSEDFIINYLPKMFNNGLIDIVDLKLSPYGNAGLLDNGTIVCQHEEPECKLNTVEACAINAWPVVTDHFPFIYCVEALAEQSKYDEWETCFENLKLDPNPVTECIISGRGYKLKLEYADEIRALNPPNLYVPWVVVDGQPLLDDYKNFTSYVCKAYKGPNPPQACRGL
ncbi:gamma-interferon-responsive lysosomal thiol protein-like [Bidens hawaiensis]|uniref:gamma-interferon-responsive lysosomal thiol protein-like n=1 Tax=Bidens hawaiensis TaxID=980011 RepID=UPI004049BF33